MEGHKINTAPEFVLTDNLKAHRGLIMSEVPERRRFRKGQQLKPRRHALAAGVLYPGGRGARERGERIRL